MFTEYSTWFILLICVFAISLAYFQYFYKANVKTSFTKKQRYILSILRFLGIFLILLLFISPVKRIKNRQIEKPTIVILQDNSASLKNHNLSDKQAEEYLKNLQKLSDELKKDYNIVRMSFGHKINELKDNETYDKIIKFNDFATNLNSALERVSEEYSSENLSAMILATDGIATEGENILNNADNFSCPIYTIAMGDTTIQKDICISNIQYNKVVFLGADYPIELTIKADKAINESSALFMTKDGRTSQIKKLKIIDNNYSTIVPLKLNSKKPGVEKISFYIKELNGETNKINNRKNIFIEVLDTKKQILILASAPHPDISAIKTALQNNENYTIMISTDLIDRNTTPYDLIILHNLPNSSSSMNIIKKLLEQNKNLLFIVGQDVNSQYFNALKTGISIADLSTTMNQTLPVYNSTFSLFNVSEDITDVLKNMSPMLSKTAKYSVNATIKTLLFQKIGSVTTDYPLIAFNNSEQKHIGFIFGENIWRWRLQNYLLNNSTSAIDDLILKTAQLLSNKQNNSKFRIEKKDIYLQKEDIILSAQLYNDNYELINEPEVIIKIIGKGNSGTYNFAKDNNAYTLNIGSLPEGEYSFIASTEYDGKKYYERGNFVVSAENMELMNLTAKHNMLYTLSAKTNAQLVYPLDVFTLKEIIQKNESIKPIIHINIENKKFISLWWYWLMIILALGTEWFLRKYWGKI